MKCYVIKGTYDVIYEGEIVKAVDESGSTEFKADIKDYHIYDFDRKLWEQWPLDNIHKNILLSKEMFKGRVREFPSYETARRTCEENLR